MTRVPAPSEEEAGFLVATAASLLASGGTWHDTEVGALLLQSQILLLAFRSSRGRRVPAPFNTVLSFTSMRHEARSVDTTWTTDLKLTLVIEGIRGFIRSAVSSRRKPASSSEVSSA